MHFATLILCLVVALLSASHPVIGSQDSCPASIAELSCGLQEKRFLLYSVRAGEGFNLCRDVYMRMVQVAVAVRQSAGLDVTLVLPQWGPLPHWKSDAANVNLSWSRFFDVASLNLLTPVMEMADFRADISHGPELHLRMTHFPDTFSSQSKWMKRYKVCDCQENDCKQDDEHNEEANDLCCNCRCAGSHFPLTKCLLLDGTSVTLATAIQAHFQEHESILISNADVVLHENYGSHFFWEIRRSMRFSKILIQKGNSFRTEFLDSDDIRDGTEMSEDWRTMQRSAGQASGGKYLALHWRRADFAIHRKDVPSIQCTAKQVIRIIQAYDLSRLFLATDATQQEIDILVQLLHNSAIEVHIFKDKGPTPLLDGEKAIIDQWICSRARLFIGSYGSTFSFRIQEEREILGFLPETTFNALCAKCDGREGRICKQELRWRIKYPTSDTNIPIS